MFTNIDKFIAAVVGNLSAFAVANGWITGELSELLMPAILSVTALAVYFVPNKARA